MNIEKNMNESIITIAFKSDFTFNQKQENFILDIIKKYQLTVLCPFSHTMNNQTYNGNIYKTNQNIDDINTVIISYFRENVIIFNKRLYLYAKNTKRIISYNENIYGFYNLIKERFQQLYVQLTETMLGCKYNKDDRFYLLYICENSNDELIVSFRKNINNKESTKETINKVDYDIEKKIIDFLTKAISNKPSIIEKNNRDKIKEQKLYNKFVFPNIVNKNCKIIFDSLKVIDNLADNKNRKKIVLNKSDGEVICDSSYEEKILNDLDCCCFVKKIKTQSLSIDYHRSGKRIIRHYIPDIQILLEDNSMVIIEIKPKEDMIKIRNVKKYYALKDYCENNGYGYCMIDSDKTSFEDIINMNVDPIKTKLFLNYMKKNKVKSLDKCESYRNSKKITQMEMFKIIIDNPKKLSYYGFKLHYK